MIGVPWPQADYVRALEDAGAEVRELTPARDPLPMGLDGCDGLLLTGGADVDPARYGETSSHPTVHSDSARDEYELPLTRLAMTRGLPVLAICRGMQMLNVAARGTLIQDLPTACPSAVTHRVPEPRSAIAHTVGVRPASRLEALVRDETDEDGRTPVNSRHHQAVREVAPGFLASAVAPDGVVEGIERPGADFCVGVQWHPENFESGQFAGLFTGFLEAAAAYRRSRVS